MPISSNDINFQYFQIEPSEKGTDTHKRMTFFLKKFFR